MRRYLPPNNEICPQTKINSLSFHLTILIGSFFCQTNNHTMLSKEKFGAMIYFVKDVLCLIVVAS